MGTSLKHTDLAKWRVDVETLNTEMASHNTPHPMKSTRYFRFCALLAATGGTFFG